MWRQGDWGGAAWGQHVLGTCLRCSSPIGSSHSPTLSSLIAAMAVEDCPLHGLQAWWDNFKLWVSHLDHTLILAGLVALAVPVVLTLIAVKLLNALLGWRVPSISVEPITGGFPPPAHCQVLHNASASRRRRLMPRGRCRRQPPPPAAARSVDPCLLLSTMPLWPPSPSCLPQRTCPAPLCCCLQARRRRRRPSGRAAVPASPATTRAQGSCWAMCPP